MTYGLLIQPLFNGLILLYETLAFGNLGVAVVELTVILRLLLLPLSIVDERKKARYERLSDEVDKIQDAFKNDPVTANEQIRALLAKHKVNHWAKGLVLLVQLGVLLALYQVFISGIRENLAGLYSWVPAPDGPINASFLGFDLGGRNFWWALAVGVILFLEIAHEQRQVIHLLGKRDAVFRYAFPILTVVVLSFLPMVKALFILTSMMFTTLTGVIRRAIWPTG